MLAIFEGTFFSVLVVYACTVIALPLSDRMLAKQGVLIRTLAALLIAATLLTLLFHGLLAVSLFDRVAAGLLLVAAIAGSHAAGFGHRAMIAVLARDARKLGRCIGRIRSWPARAFYGVIALVVALSAARSIILPTVGWDSITYHYVKAAMWVQSGGPVTLDAPGGWSMYRSIFGGGEIFTAWAMLPFGNDLLAGWVDVVWWGACGLALVALGGELGLRVRQRLAVAIYGVFVPAAWDEVGWGYVDLACTALLLIGLVFAIRALRRREPEAVLLSLLALGLASGVKLTAVPFAGMTAVALLVSLVREREQRIARLRMFAMGGVAGLVFVSPWLVSNFLDTGYPLRFPMTIAGFQLGADNPAFAWSQDRTLPAFTIRAEFEALAKLFQLPSVNESHLSALTLPALLLAPVGFARLFRSRADLRGGLVVLVCLCIAVLLAFYNAAFSFSRLEFTWVNGRFLMPIAFVALPLAVAALPQRGRSRDVIAIYFAAAVLMHFGFFLPMRLTLPSATLVILGTCALLAFATGIGLIARASLVRKTISSQVVVILVISLAWLACYGLGALRDVDQRYLMLANRNVSADVFRYWWQAAYLIEKDGTPARVALTAGPRQDADNWLMYYFMGRDLQNTLHYVPISTDGKIIPFGPHTRRQDEGDYSSWFSRLNEQGISHVFSFFPTSLELGWMDSRPESFERLVGDAEHWALFRVLEATGAAKEQRGAPSNSRTVDSK